MAGTGKGKDKLFFPPVSPPFYKNSSQFDKTKEPDSSKTSYIVLLSLYIQKLKPLLICYLDHLLEQLQNEDPAIFASNILLKFCLFQGFPKKLDIIMS